MKAPTAIIAEDEPLLRGEIRQAFHRLWPELVIAAEVGDGLQAMQAIDRYAPDVVLLDIHMPGMSGLDVAQHASGKAHVVFITAFDEHAVAAFEQGALDYILKPVTIERMKLAVTRLQERLYHPPADLRGLADLLRNVAAGEPQYLKWLTVPHGSELRVMAVAGIS